MDEKITAIRRVLDDFNYGVVSLHWLSGTIETTANGIYRTFADDGDRAFVVLGPKDKLVVERREEEDGAIIYTFRFPPTVA